MKPHTISPGLLLPWQYAILTLTLNHIWSQQASVFQISYISFPSLATRVQRPLQTNRRNATVWFWWSTGNQLALWNGTERHSHNEILMSPGSLERFSAPYADSPPNTRPAISDMTLPAEWHWRTRWWSEWINEQIIAWGQWFSRYEVLYLFSCSP